MPWGSIAMPNNIYENILVGTDDYLYSFSGKIGNTLTTACYKCSTATKQWTPIANSPTTFPLMNQLVILTTIQKQTQPACLVGKDLIVIFSGRWAYLYSIEYNLWVSSRYLTTNVRACASYGDRVYISNGTGSFSLLDVSSWVEYPLSSIPVEDSRSEYSLAANQNSVFCIGGRTGIDLPGPTNTLKSTDRVDEYNISTASWLRISDIPTSAWFVQSELIGSDIYCVGGNYEEIGIEIVLTRNTYILNSETKLWNSGEIAPINCIGAASWGALLALTPYSSGNPVYYYDTSTATLVNISPATGFVDERISNTFSWKLSVSPLSAYQTSAIFQWRVKNSSTINTINLTTEQSVTIPAGVLPAGLFEWRVQATASNGITTPFSAWNELTTIDAIPDKPTGLYPNSGARDGTRPIQFSWIHRNRYSTPQSAFELQTTYDNGLTWNNLSGKIISPNTQYLAPENSIIPTNDTGQVGWRVRTYNTDNVAGEWSDIVFILINAAPQTPRWVSVESGRSRPLSRWISLGQIGFQIQVMSGNINIFDSGEKFGINTEYCIPDYLANGTYTFRLRIKNILGLWSEWAEFLALINARQTLAIILSGESIKDGARLTFDADVR